MNHKTAILATALFLGIHCARSENKDISTAIETADSYVSTNPDSALILADKAIREFGSDLGKPDLAALEIVKSTAYYSMGKMPQAIACVSRGAAIASEASDTAMMIEAFSNAGVYHRIMQHPDSALICYNKALSLIEKAGDAEDRASILTSIAVLFGSTDRYAEAVPYVRKAISAAEDCGSLPTMIYAASQGGIVLFKAGHQEEALGVERKIIDMAQKQAAPRYVLKAYTAIMGMHQQMGNNDSVTAYVGKGEELLRHISDTSIESIGFLNQTAIFYSATGKYRESLDMQKKILAMKDAALYVPLDELWRGIASNYRKMGDPDRCAEAYEQSIAATDSMRNIEIDNQLSEFDVRYNTMQKQLEISTLRQERARTRVFIAIGIAIAAVLAVAAAAFFVNRRRREALERIRQNLKGVEQERARLARELHDGVCNDLYGVGLMMGLSGAGNGELRGEIERICGEVRHISHELMPPRFAGTSLRELAEDLARRSGGFLTCSAEEEAGYDVPEEKSYQAYRILQELVANIRKHTDAGSASLRIYRDNDRTILLLSYKGKALGATSEKDGIGLTTTERRAQLIGADIQKTISGEEVRVRIAI